MKVLLGGRVAEEIIFKEVSTGAQNDLERCTAIARSMVTEYGMSAKLGPLFYAKEKRNLFLGAELGGEQHSEKIASEIDVEVRDLVEDAYHEATKLLKRNRDKLEALARLLLEKEVVERDELLQVLDGRIASRAAAEERAAHRNNDKETW
jgi:cell division protease FtsH